MHNRSNEESGTEASARDAITFVADLTGELSSIARQHHFETLAHLLDMAKLEAENIRRDLNDDS